jgi:hypothetical protein
MEKRQQKAKRRRQHYTDRIKGIKSREKITFHRPTRRQKNGAHIPVNLRKLLSFKLPSKPRGEILNFEHGF